jgi:pantetheine-phosphate adenylyltransferase
MLRGLRTLSDMEYEFNMSLTNQNLDAEIETVFLMAQVEHSHFSSSLIRQIMRLGGDLHPFVPPEVEAAVLARAAERRDLSYRDDR